MRVIGTFVVVMMLVSCGTSPAPGTPSGAAPPATIAIAEAPPSAAPPALEPSSTSATPEPRANEGSTTERPIQAPSDAEVRECAARGGRMQPVCMMGHVTCVVIFRDAGRPCTDKKDCTGICEYQGNPPPPGTPAVGHCQRLSDPCGCRKEVIGGQVQPMMCVD
jgi:hypothetical protein